jgi:hypothetical protein
MPKFMDSLPSQSGSGFATDAASEGPQVQTESGSGFATDAVSGGQLMRKRTVNATISVCGGQKKKQHRVKYA